MSSVDWYGAKRFVKRALSVTPINQLLVMGIRRFEPTPSLARLPVAVPEVIGRVRGAEFVMTNPSACSIAKELFWGRGARVHDDERIALDVFFDLSREAELILDIGANTGIFSLCAANATSTARIEAFEIVPAVFEVLFRNVVRNDLANRIACRFEGVSRDGMVLRVPSFANKSSLPTSASILNQPPEGTLVPCTSLDEIMASRLSARTLMKIDVEGGEDVLFENATRALTCDVDIVCEVLPGTDPRSVIPRVMSTHGYNLYRIEDCGLRHMSRIEPSSIFHDWLFSKRLPSALSRRTSVPILE